MKPCHLCLKGRPELSLFSRAYTAYAGREVVKGCCTLGGRWSRAAVRWEGGGQGLLYAGREVVKGCCTLGGRWSRAAVRWEGGGQGLLYAGREVVNGCCMLGGRWSRAAVRWEGGGQRLLYASQKCCLWCDFESILLVGRKGVTKKSTVYAPDNVDNNERPLIDFPLGNSVNHQQLYLWLPRRLLEKVPTTCCCKRHKFKSYVIQ